jgi:hypothetical protein
MPRTRAPKTRSILRKIAGSDSHKQLTTPNMVDMLLKDHRKTVMDEIEDHLRISIAKIANSVVLIRNPNPDQQELFREYSIAERISIPVVGEDGSKRAFYLIKDTPISILKQYLADRNKPKKSSASDREIARAVEELEPYASSGDMTLPEAWEQRKKTG